MIISVVNFTKSVKDEVVQNTIRAINRQVSEDFEPYWHMGGKLRLEGPGTKENRQSPEELRGDAIIYLWDQIADVKDALGYHDLNNRGIPYGFVFTEVARQMKEPWSVTLSHEALEIIGDAEVNILAAGPHPTKPQQLVYYWYEMCDAVQAETYPMDGIAVSNFVLPLYFTTDSEIGARNDFLGRRYNGQTLKSFGVNPGGYVGFFNPAKNKDETFAQFGDVLAKNRLQMKKQLKLARRAARYRNLATAIKKNLSWAASV